MDDRAQFLLRQIAFYRRLLAKGVVGELTRKYLGEITKAEAELAEIEKTGEKKE